MPTASRRSVREDRGGRNLFVVVEFTGERFHPDGLREIWYEHYHRYAVALPAVRGRRVLDCACGEGYGSWLLSSTAGSVVGVDVSREAVDHARSEYNRDQLSFECADAAALPFPDDAFDVVVSFETIEHLHAQREMLAEFRRVLDPSGVLIVSSPDRRTYSDEREYENEFHVAELYKDEFEALLKEQFPAIRLFGQKLVFASLIWEEGAESPSSNAQCVDRESAELVEFQPDPLYWIAVAGASTATVDSVQLHSMNLFMDQDESVYAHYYHEIRKNMEAGAILADRDARIRELEHASSERKPKRRWWPFG